MKSKDEITARIQDLCAQLMKDDADRKAHARKTGAKRSTLGIRFIRETEGKISALEWALENNPTA